MSTQTLTLVQEDEIIGKENFASPGLLAARSKELYRIAAKLPAGTRVRVDIEQAAYAASSTAARLLYERNRK